MTALFADTFYWIALIDVSGSAHRRLDAQRDVLGGGAGRASLMPVLTGR
jgi:hypothetical protein